MVRRDRSRRLKWLDLHNLLGIGTAGCLLVVGLTGVINTLDEPLYASWQKGEIAHLTRHYAGKPIPDHFDSIEQAVQEARKAQPELKPPVVRYPGTGYSGDTHSGLVKKGNPTPSDRDETPRGGKEG